ncbi:MAG: DnaJ domain-containing protein [Actinomycetota bacterium]|nr:DnaJ domain-containing protein [Actinomycetota bacterium]
MSDSYAALGVDPTADATELRRAWRRRARETHPDHGGDAAAFIVVEQAFRRLAPLAETRSAPVLVRRLGPTALALRWWHRRSERTRHPRVA